MTSGSKYDFELLKKKIIAVMQQTYPGINPEISDWKSQEITDFQEELNRKVRAHISEKWFYNHFKQQDQPLPRIDMLNLLSRYTGYLNWDDFLYRNSVKTDSAKLPGSFNRYFVYIPLAVIGISLTFFVLFKIFSIREFRISFYDGLTKEPVTGNKTEVLVLQGDESPVQKICDSDGIFFFKTGEKVIKMVVNSPYYQTDTFTCVLRPFDREMQIALNPDDYSRMIQYYSELEVTDWEKRRASLDSIIDDNAMIYQVGGGKSQLGVELFNKQEFIGKLMVPAVSLRHLDILESKVREGRIVILRFRIEDN